MDWITKENHLQKNFNFLSFSKAIEFINSVAKIAEELNHHPDLLLHSYNQVLVKTMTHDAQMITAKDVELSKKIDALVK
jgi:4a-hydroxytetrahydrobiopterin dehydratase